VVESFRGLARGRHRLDPAPAARTGRFTATPPGGWADLRDVRGAAAAGGPFDEHAHTPEVRRGGRWNLPKLVFHLHRVPALPIGGVIPFARDPATFTFDPSGRSIALFAPRRRPESWDQWRTLLPWELPAPIGCRLLAHAEYAIDERLVRAIEASGLTDAALELRGLIGVRFRSERELRLRLSLFAHGGDLTAPGTWETILAGAIVDECGARALLPAALAVAPDGVTAVARERTAAGNLVDWSASAPGKDLLVDPERGRFRLTSAPASPGAVRVAYHYGCPGPIGAGTHDRSAVVRPPPRTLVPAGGGAIGPLPAAGVLEVQDSATYGPLASAAGVRDLVVQAADGARPYVRLAADWVLEAAAGVEATLEVDGLWLGADAPRAVVLRGAWSRVVFRHVSFDPGGVDAAGATIHPVELIIDGPIDALIVERSITAAIRVQGGAVDRVTIADAIVDGQRSPAPALDLPAIRVELRRVTVLGEVDVEGLDASDALITGAVDVTDTDGGCFRFSAAPAGSRLPHPYRAVELAARGGLFASTGFGRADYALLAEGAPREIARGGEDGGEMGAWSGLALPGKLDGLIRKVQEYLPFGLIPHFARRT
jgi:hypothetical protein